MKHEGAWCQEARDGRLVVYMGDDEVFEYIYRYVSRQPWRQMRRAGISPLNRGTLYVAKFNDNGTGRWLPLTPSNPNLAGWSLADILINTRGAADLAGGTRMDRPEWIDTFPDALTAVATLTNNSSRGAIGTNPRTGFPFDPVNAVNPRAANAYGQVVTWSYRARFHRADLPVGPLRARRGSRACRPPARRSRVTSTARRTAFTSRRAAGCGSRPTSRAARSTPAPMPVSATTRCCVPTRSRGRRVASWSGRASARSPASSSRPTNARCSSASSTRARRPRVPTIRPTPSNTAPGPMGRRAGVRARRWSSSPRTTAGKIGS